MDEQIKMYDIPSYNSWKYISQIKSGFSSDMKYYIRTQDSRELFLRLSDASLYEKKKQEHQIINRMHELGVPSICGIDIGLCNNGKMVYMLQTWIKGQLLEDVLPTLSVDRQYSLGIEAGRILKMIHSYKSEVPCNWYETRLNEYLLNYEKYKQCNINYIYENKINNYVMANINLLKDKRITLVHGDYHAGNMILSPNGEIIIIDFDRFGWKDPMEDFYKLAVFSRNVSIPFCIGQINGYTDSKPDSYFWAEYSLCIAMTSFLSLLWGKQRSEKLFAYRKKLCDILVDDHNCFKEKVPKWYRYIE